MSDDLVKRLDSFDADDLHREAADRIEELEAANRGLVRLNEATEARAKTAEAKLAKAVEALGCIARQKKTDELETEYGVEVGDFEAGYDTCIDVARATLAELTGGKDE